MRKLLVLCLMLLPMAASAQQGTILFDVAVQFDYDLVPEARQALRDQIPPQTITSMVLFFSESESLMTGVASTEAPPPPPSDRVDRLDPAALVARLRVGSTARSDQEKLLQAYVNYEDGTAADAREFMGRDFLITGEQPSFAWRLPGERSELLGFMVQKATAVQDSTTIEAWFTPEIPLSGGPGGYGGLPGMILAVSVDDGRLVYSATKVDLDAVADGVIVPPEGGNEVSRDEYEEIVAEKLEELRRLGPRPQATDVRRRR